MSKPDTPALSTRRNSLQDDSSIDDTDFSDYDSDKPLLPDRRKTPRGRICIILDSPNTRRRIRENLADSSLRVKFEYQDLDEIQDVDGTRRRSDLFILGLDLLNTRGVDTLKKARKLFGNKKFFVYLYEQDIPLAIECYLSGAAGVFFERSAAIGALKQGLLQCLHGDIYIQRSAESLIDPEMIEKERRKRIIESKLSASEYRILMMLADGIHPDDIASSLDMTPASVHTKISLIKKKLGITRRLIWRTIVNCYLLGSPP